jgi:hypothetical protein
MREVALEQLAERVRPPTFLSLSLSFLLFAGVRSVRFVLTSAPPTQGRSESKVSPEESHLMAGRPPGIRMSGYLYKKVSLRAKSVLISAF